MSLSHSQKPFLTFFRRGAAACALVAVIAAGSASLPVARAQQPRQKTFRSAAQASQALVAAVQAAIQTNDQQALLKILGPDAKDIVSSGDPVEDKNQREQFVACYQKMHRLVKEPDGATTLYIGAENWPTPIPLVNKSGSAWYFDTAAGKQEILFRRVGENELSAIQVLRELVDAEKEYFAAPHDNDSTRQYAQKFFSDPNKHNGLYWAASGEPESPIGPMVAAAAAEGYAPNPDQKPQPFHGYYFRILTAQGPQAPGGAKTYVVDGKMTGGVGFVAYPAEYRASGVMTFIVDQNGIVYEKDLGPTTEQAAKAMTTYNPNGTWREAD